MKNIRVLSSSFLILCLSFLSFITSSCQSDYVVSQYYSREEEYANFNKSCKNKSLKIILNNDSTFFAPDGARISNDTLILLTKDQNVIAGYIQISNVKEVSYNKRWLGVPFGILTGGVLGSLAGAVGIIPVYESHPNMNGGQTQTIETGGAMVYGCLAGIGIGGIIGWLIGYNYIYYFNQ